MGEPPRCLLNQLALNSALVHQALLPRPIHSNFLTTALASHAVVDVRGLRWGFYEPRTLEEENGPFLTGFLVKYKPDAEEEVVVPARHTLEDKSIENRVTAKSRFFLHVFSGLIAYHPVGNHISRQLFARRFAEVLERSVQNFFVNVEIQSIEEQYKLVDELRSFTAIRTVSIYLHPSNPSSRDIWQRLDQRMRAMNASSYREKYDSDRREGSLKGVEDDTDIRAKIAMAEDGYGKIEVVGEKDGRLLKVSTRDNPLSIPAPASDDTSDEAFPVIRDAIASFFGRFRQ